jgi:hypothetical protein
VRDPENNKHDDRETEVHDDVLQCVFVVRAPVHRNVIASIKSLAALEIALLGPIYQKLIKDPLFRAQPDFAAATSCFSLAIWLDMMLMRLM